MTMENHYPTMTAALMFQERGPNAPHNFCTTCELRISDPIHSMIDDYCQMCKAQESDYGCHGIKDGKNYDEYYCKECYNRRS